MAGLTFSAQDVIRIYTNHLTPLEQLEVIEELSGIGRLFNAEQLASLRKTFDRIFGPDGVLAQILIFSQQGIELFQPLIDALDEIAEFREFLREVEEALGDIPLVGSTLRGRIGVFIQVFILLLDYVDPLREYIQGLQDWVDGYIITIAQGNEWIERLRQLLEQEEL